MAPVSSFRDLDAWQISMLLVEKCYALCAILPAEERYGLADQLRRAAVSVPSNVAEGHRLQRGLYRQHVTVALGSLAEVESLLELVKRLRLADPECLHECESYAASVRRLLYGLRRSLRRSSDSSA